VLFNELSPAAQGRQEVNRQLYAFTEFAAAATLSLYAEVLKFLRTSVPALLTERIEFLRR